MIAYGVIVYIFIFPGPPFQNFLTWILELKLFDPNKFFPFKKHDCQEYNFLFTIIHIKVHQLFNFLFSPVKNNRIKFSIYYLVSLFPLVTIVIRKTDIIFSSAHLIWKQCVLDCLVPKSRWFYKKSFERGFIAQTINECGLSKTKLLP